MNATKGIGTPRYMAPEILEGNPNYKLAKACDVYSYSIVLVEVWEVTDAYQDHTELNNFTLATFIIGGGVNK